MPAPNLWQDKDFLKLNPRDKQAVMQELDSDFAGLHPREQQQVIFQLTEGTGSERVIDVGGMQTGHTPGARVMPDSRSIGRKVVDYAKSPTEPATGAMDWATRVVPESAAKLAVNVPVSTYEMVKGQTDPLIKAVTSNDPNYRPGAEMRSNAVDALKGLADFTTRPLGFGRNEEGNVTWGVDNLKQALATDPVGLAVAGLPLAKPGIKAATKYGGKTVRASGDFAAGVLGTTTGTGKEYIKQAARGGEGFRQAMRNPDGERVVATAKNALNTLKESRGSEYRAQLESIAADKQQLDIAPIQEQWQIVKRKFGIKEKPAVNMHGKEIAGKTVPDLDRSTLSRKEGGDIAEIAEMLDGWGKQEGDLTPMGLDLLKRKLDNLYTESRDSRAIVAGLRNTVKQTIVKSVPEYATMTKGYEEATKLITELDRTLSLGKKPMLDTTMRKLQQSMRDNFQFRKELLDTLEMKSGEELADMIAGYSMSSWAPQGGFGKLTAGGAGAGMAISHAVTPAYIGMMALSSPRVVGETLSALGASGRQIKKVIKALPAAKALIKTQAASNPD